MSLPTEIDFSADPAASPERMNRAMDYIVARIRAVESLAPAISNAVEALREAGLSRLSETLIPIFDQANEIVDALAALKAVWEAEQTFQEAVAAVTEAVSEEFADYRHRYLGSRAAAPTVRDDGSPVGVGDMFFNTTTDQMQVLASSGWKNAGSAVPGVMNQFAAITASSGQAVFNIPGGYDPGYLILTLDGRTLAPDEFTATNGSTATLATPVTAGAKLAGVAFGAVTLSNVYSKAQIDSGFAAIGAAYTKAESDLRFALIGASYTKGDADNRFARSDLSNIPDASAARGNLGVGSAGTRGDNYFLKTAQGGTMTVSTANPSGGLDNDIWIKVPS